MDLERISKEDAKAAGLKRYFTGIACKAGHVAERYVSGGQCCDCTNAAFRAYRLANKSREKKRRREYYAKNRQTELPRAKAYQAELRAAGRDYYSQNAEAIREKRRLERRSNPGAVRAKDRAIRERFKPKVNAQKRNYERRHPEVRKVKRQKRRASERGAPGRHTATQVRGLYEKQRGKCAFCFARLRGRYDEDHYVALAKGGSNDIANIQLLCQPCNQKKHATDPFEFAQRNGRLL